MSQTAENNKFVSHIFAFPVPCLLASKVRKGIVAFKDNSQRIKYQALQLRITESTAFYIMFYKDTSKPRVDVSSFYSNVQITEGTRYTAVAQAT